MELTRRDRELLERGVRALEKIAEEPILQTEGGPPICPHCNTLNPRVTVSADESDGPLAEFALVAKCGPCGGTIFGVPLEWGLFTNPEEAREEIARRRAVLNGNGSD